MAKRKIHFGDYTRVDGNVKVNINFSKFDKRFQRAQFALDTRVMTDMAPLMPQGVFISNTRRMSMAIAGSGEVVAAAPPYGRFLYYGKLMVDPETGSPWAREGVKKVLTDKPLTYSNPKAVPEWFEVAKDRHAKQWVRLVENHLKGD